MYLILYNINVPQHHSAHHSAHSCPYKPKMHSSLPQSLRPISPRGRNVAENWPQNHLTPTIWPQNRSKKFFHTFAISSLAALFYIPSTWWELGIMETVVLKAWTSSPFKRFYHTVGFSCNHDKSVTDNFGSNWLYWGTKWIRKNLMWWGEQHLGAMAI